MLMNKVIVTYRKNPLYSERHTSEQPRLFAKLDLHELGVETQIKNLTIYYKKLEKPVGPIRVVYTTFLAGLALEAGNLNRLEEAIDSTLKTLIRFGKLPEYLFQVDENAYPIYHLSGELLTRYPGGPVFETKDIASLKAWLADHFKSIGRITNRRDLGLLYLSPFDLGLYAPHCVIRTPDIDDPDIPVFPAPFEQGFHLIAPVNSISLKVPFDNHKGVLAIHQEVESYLLERKRLSRRYATTIRKLPSAYWEKLQRTLTPHPSQLTFYRDLGQGMQRHSLPVYQQGDGYLTGRVNRLGGTVIFFATDLNNLQRCVGEDLASYEAIGHPDDVKITPSKKQKVVKQEAISLFNQGLSGSTPS